MRDYLKLQVRQALPRATRLATISAPVFLALAPQAFAQDVAGEIDPSTGLAALAPYILLLVNVGFVIVAMYKGLHAFMEGRSFGTIVAALVLGLTVADGGYYLLNHYGVSTTST